jgi:hypothetical protein
LNICGPHSQALFDYPVHFEDLAQYTEEERQRIWKDCRRVYDEIKDEKIKDIMAQNGGMF